MKADPGWGGTVAGDEAGKGLHISTGRLKHSPADSLHDMLP